MTERTVLQDFSEGIAAIVTERTVLQDFSEGIAAIVTGEPKGVVRAGIDAGVVEWMVLIEMIMSIVAQFMEKCQQSKAKTQADIRDPSMWQRVKFRSACRQECRDCSLPHWRSKGNEIADALLGAGKTEEDAVVGQIIDQCREGGY